MAGFRPFPRRVDVFDDADDIDDWMLGRSAQVAGRAKDEAAGRQTWEDGTRDGVPVSAARPSDLIALGKSTAPPADPDGSAGYAQAHTSEGGSSVEPADLAAPDGPLVTTPRLRFVSAKPGDSISSLVGSNDPAAIGRFLSLNNMEPGQSTIRSGLSYVVPTSFDDASHDERAAGHRALGTDNRRVAAIRADRARRQADIDRQARLLLAGRNIWTGVPVSSPAPRRASPPKAPSHPRPRSWMDDSSLAKKNAGAAAEMVGQGYGVLRGGWHTVKSLGTAARLFNPLDPFLSPDGEAAWDQVMRNGRRYVSGIKRRVAHPGLLADDLHNLNVALNPNATPMAGTLSGELKRRFDIGANQGEAALNLAPVLPGGRVARALEAMVVAKEAPAVAAYVRATLPPEEAAYMLEPYQGMGAHYVPRRTKMPSLLGGGPLPSWFIDSPFNVSELQGATRWQQYKHHFMNDPKYGGGRLPNRRGKGSGWSGRRYGWERNGPITRAIEGLPADTQGLIGGAAVAGMLSASDVVNRDQTQ